MRKEIKKILQSLESEHYTYNRCKWAGNDDTKGCLELQSNVLKCVAENQILLQIDFRGVLSYKNHTL